MLIRSLFFVSIVVLTLPARADSITLHRSVRMPVDRDHLTLADIARLEGDAALELADTIVFTSDDPAQLQTVSVDVVRAALDDAGVLWSALHLSGGDIIIRPRPASLNTKPQAMQPASLGEIVEESTPPIEESAPQNATLIAASIIDEVTIRSAIAARFLAALRVDAGDLSLTFDAVDEPFLSSGIDDAASSQRIEIDPATVFESERVQLEVRIWQDGRVVQSERIEVQPRIRATALTVSQNIERGQRIEAAHLVRSESWMSPGSARLCALEGDVVGCITDRPLTRGDLLRARDLAQEHIIARGDRVTVRCLSGGIVITLEAEARTDAAIGAEIELRRAGERDTFFARASGPGEAILDLSSR